MPTLITVFTDASFRAGYAGFGYWFKSSQRTQTGSGSAEVLTNNEAELLACLCGMRAALEGHSTTADPALIVQSDSLVALGTLYTLGVGVPAKSSTHRIERRSRISPSEQAAVQSFLNEYGSFPCWLKHVKGHSGGCSRTYVNGWTDELARKARLALEAKKVTK